MSANKQYKKLRVFVASPGDVITERAHLVSVIESLNHGLADYLGLVLELKEWGQVAPGMGRAEDVILAQLSVETWDIFIGILWLRFGTPTGTIDVEANQPFESGTEEEFKLAYRAWKETGRPRIMFYRCSRPPSTLIGLNVDQFIRIESFFQHFDANSGSHPGLYKTYDTAETFGRLVRDHVERFLIEYGDQVQHKSISPEVIQTFAPNIPNTLPRRMPFFGRKDAILKALRALNRDERGWGLVIDGIGGMGKTALAVEVAYICKDRGDFDAFIFVTAKLERLEATGIQEITLSDASLDGFINEVSRAIGHPDIAQLRGIEEKQRALIDVLQGWRALIIFDNLETLTPSEQNSISDFLRFLPQECKAIVTTRKRVGESVATLRLGKLKWDEASELITSQIKQHLSDLKQLEFVGEIGWKQLYDHAGGSPLALLWTIGLIRARGLSFDRALEILRNGSPQNDLNAFLYAEARTTMDPNERATLGALSFFAVPATPDALAATAGLEQPAIFTVLERLHALSLVDVVEKFLPGESSEERYTLHPLTCRFAQSDLKTDQVESRSIGMRFSNYWVNYTRQYAVGLGIQSTFDHLEAEWGNYQVAINWLAEVAGIRRNLVSDRDAARMLIRLILGLQLFLRLSDRFNELVELSSQAYFAAYASGDWGTAETIAQDIASIYKESNDPEQALVWREKAINAKLKTKQTVRIFLSHASQDKVLVRDLYRKLRNDGFDPWLDEEQLLPGMDWSLATSKAIRNSDVILICLSNASINKAGYIQKEIKVALDVADEQPEDTLFLIPVKLEECNIPDRLRRWHWVNLYEEKGYEQLRRALSTRANILGISTTQH